MDSRSSRRAGRSKAKSGCRTCKIRKVKCDEGRPACHRCTSTGRVCDGYGIWGGGGNYYGHRYRLAGLEDSRVIPRSPASFSASVTGIDEKEHLEWFKCRIITKLPGSFISSFWTTLLLQASLKEPAVLHAVLALSSIHKGGTIKAESGTSSDTVLEKQEQFTLQHYIKAIGHLQPHFSNKDRSSVRVALIACVVFVCLEFLRGHFNTAQTHFKNGLKVLGEMQKLSSRNDGSLHLKPCRESTDDWIIEVFSRLCLQMELFEHDHQHPCLVLQPAGYETPALAFHSINEAWQELGRLLNKVFHLNHQARQQAASECESLPHPLTMLGHQQHVRVELARWLGLYEVFMEPLLGHTSAYEERGYQLPRVYHALANIMADACLHPDDETRFDSYTDQFVLLLRQLANLQTVASMTPAVRILPGRLMDMSRSIVDMGWIAPLYYTAIKCRVHRIRLQAIRLLESTSHREGIWDSNTTACVARKVVEVEERDFYKDVDTGDAFPLIGSPRPQDLLLPSLPGSYRIREAEVVLSGAPMDKVLLFCKQKREGKDFRVLISEYDVSLRRWIDVRKH